MIINATIVVHFIVREADTKYERTWCFKGTGFDAGRTVVVNNSLELKGLSIKLYFYMFDEKSPFLIALDLKRYSNNENMPADILFWFGKPNDTKLMKLSVYMSITSELDAPRGVYLCAVVNRDEADTSGSVISAYFSNFRFCGLIGSVFLCYL